MAAGGDPRPRGGGFGVARPRRRLRRRGDTPGHGHAAPGHPGGAGGPAPADGGREEDDQGARGSHPAAPDRSPAHAPPPALRRLRPEESPPARAPASRGAAAAAVLSSIAQTENILLQFFRKGFAVMEVEVDYDYQP